MTRLKAVLNVLSYASEAAKSHPIGYTGHRAETAKAKT
jgi:hypothetical protein